jgi:hypothetical protein
MPVFRKIRPPFRRAGNHLKKHYPQNPAKRPFRTFGGTITPMTTVRPDERNSLKVCSFVAWNAEFAKA